METSQSLLGRCMFIDGPLTVIVREGSEAEILEALLRVSRYVKVAARELDQEALRKQENA